MPGAGFDTLANGPNHLYWGGGCCYSWMTCYQKEVPVGLLSLPAITGSQCVKLIAAKLHVSPPPPSPPPLPPPSPVNPLVFHEPAEIHFTSQTRSVNYVSGTHVHKMTGDFTYMIWIKRTGRSSDWARVFGKGSYTFRCNFGLWVHPSGRPLAQIYGYRGFSGQNAGWPHTGTISDGTWVHLAGRFVKNQVHELYVNGELRSSTSTRGTPYTDNSQITIGRAPFHLGFVGFVQDARLYNRALSAAEIRTIGAVTPPPLPPPLPPPPTPPSPPPSPTPPPPGFAFSTDTSQECNLFHTPQGLVSDCEIRYIAPPGPLITAPTMSTCSNFYRYAQTRSWHHHCSVPVTSSRDVVSVAFTWYDQGWGNCCRGHLRWTILRASGVEEELFSIYRVPRRSTRISQGPHAIDSSLVRTGGGHCGWRSPGTNVFCATTTGVTGGPLQPGDMVKMYINCCGHGHTLTLKNIQITLDSTLVLPPPPVPSPPPPQGL